jgi:hypothetical protein
MWGATVGRPFQPQEEAGLTGPGAPALLAASHDSPPGNSGHRKRATNGRPPHLGTARDMAHPSLVRGIEIIMKRDVVAVNTSPDLLLDLRPLFPYIAGYEYLPQVLHRLLQKMRSRRISWNGRVSCQLYLRRVLALRRETPLSAIRSDSWQTAFRGQEKAIPARSRGRAPRVQSRINRAA